MLRRLASTMRWALLALGVGLLLWLPVSLSCVLVASKTFARSSGTIVVLNGCAAFSWVETPESMRMPTSPTWGWQNEPNEHPVQWPSALWPHYDVDGPPWRPVHQIRLPLWLLAAICLAWPVTSFIIARRRRKRGFVIEVSGQKSEVSQRSEDDVERTT